MLFEALASLVAQLSDDPVCAELSMQLASPANVEVATKATFDRSGCRQPEPLGVYRVHRFPAPVPSTEPRVVPAVVWKLLAGTLAKSCKQRWQQKFFPPFCVQWTMKRVDAVLGPKPSRLSWNTICIAEKLPFIEAFGKYGKGFWFAKGQILVQFPLATKFPRGHTLHSVASYLNNRVMQTAS